jgi:predicted PhzF superfamily epimerase YddE/YHI9
MTAFLAPRPDGHDLRWFTPTVEVDLCGHATLASAHVLWETGRLDGERAAGFHTRSGLLTCARRGDWIEMDFPAAPAAPIEPPPGLVGALGVAARWVGRNGFDVLVEVASEDDVRALTPDLGQLRRLDARGVIVTSRSSAGGHDFVSRFFAPAIGLDEDAVSGSTHCCLGPHWGARLGKTELVGHQASARGGTVRVRLMGDRVRLAGQAVTVVRGALVG